MLANAVLSNAVARTFIRDQYFIYHEDTMIMRWEEIKQESDKLLTQARTQFPRDDAPILGGLIKNSEEMTAIFHRLATNVSEMRTAVGQPGIKEELNKRLSSQLLVKETSLRNDILRLQSITEERVWNQYYLLSILTFLLTGIVAIASLFMSANLVRLLKDRLNPLYAGATTIAGGNLEFRINSDGLDEFSDLARAVNSMADALIARGEMLRKSEALFRNFFSSVPIGMAITSPDQKWLEVNERLCAILGYTKAELTAMTWTELTHPDDLDKNMVLFHKLLSGEIENYSIDKRYIRKDGDIVYASLNVNSQRNVSNSITYLISSIDDVTDRRKTEAALQASEQMLRTIYDLVPIGISITDPEGHIIDCNKMSEMLLGITREEHLRRSYVGKEWAIVRMDGTIMPFDEYASTRALKEQQVVRDVEMGIVKPEGTTWISVSAIPSTNPNYGVIIAYVDITLRRHTEAELQETSEQLRLAFENANIGMCLVDLNGRLFKVNDKMSAIFGYSKAQLECITVNDLAVPEDTALSVDFIEKAVRGIKESTVFEKRYYHQLGNIIHTQVSSSLVRNLAGEPLYFISQVQDITDRKQALDALAVRERLFRDISDTSPLAIYMSRGIDQVGEYMNPTFTRLFGYTINDVPSANEWWPLAYPETEYRNQLMKEWQCRVERAIETHSAIKPMETVVTCKDGTERNVSWYFVSVGHQNWAFGLDFTDAKQAQIRLQRLNETLKVRTQEAQASNIAKSQFLATMSHEIRTPMNGILGMAQMLLMQDLTDYQRQDYARTILTSGKILLNLLNDILDISKIESGKIQLELLNVKPSLVIHEVAALFAESATLKSLQLEHRWLGPEASYLMDRFRLHQIIANLVGNAIKFTENGRIMVEGHEIERKDKIALLEFSVDDTGIGIAEEVQHLLFKPFSQVDSSITRKHGGSGLGLSIVQRLARMMGGDAGVESRPGYGSHFWVRIQAGVAAESNGSTGHTDNTGNTENAHHRQLAIKILVVEDNQTNSDVISAYLRKFGGSVLIAENGQRALDTITSGEHIDVILMDLHMPVMDGYTATKHIRRWEIAHKQSRHPIIAITSDAFEEDRQLCLATGMDDFLTKPVDLEKMRRIILKFPFGIEHTAPAVKVIDVPLVLQTIRRLIPLLEEKQFDAIDCYGELQQLVAGTDIAAKFSKTTHLIDQYQFDSAIESLRKIITDNCWE